MYYTCGNSTHLTQHRRDKLIMIFFIYILKLLTADSEAEDLNILFVG